MIRDIDERAGIPRRTVVVDPRTEGNHPIAERGVYEIRAPACIAGPGCEIGARGHLEPGVPKLPGAPIPGQVIPEEERAGINPMLKDSGVAAPGNEALAVVHVPGPSVGCSVAIIVIVGSDVHDEVRAYTGPAQLIGRPTPEVCQPRCEDILIVRELPETMHQRISARGIPAVVHAAVDPHAE